MLALGSPLQGASSPRRRGAPADQPYPSWDLSIPWEVPVRWPHFFGVFPVRAATRYLGPHRTDGAAPRFSKSGSMKALFSAFPTRSRGICERCSRRSSRPRHGDGAGGEVGTGALSESMSETRTDQFVPAVRAYVSASACRPTDVLAERRRRGPAHAVGCGPSAGPFSARSAFSSPQRSWAGRVVDARLNHSAGGHQRAAHQR
jgi:hypothetical protein